MVPILPHNAFARAAMLATLSMAQRARPPDAFLLRVCQSADMDRPLSDNELAVLRRLTCVDRPGAEAIRESLDYLVVDDECGCGCESVGVRDTRFPEQDHHLQSWVDARSVDGVTTLGLLLGSEGRLKYLDIYTPNQGRLPSPEDLEILP